MQPVLLWDGDGKAAQLLRRRVLDGWPANPANDDRCGASQGHPNENGALLRKNPTPCCPK